MDRLLSPRRLRLSGFADFLIADVAAAALDNSAMLRRLILSFMIGLIGLIVSFFLTNLIAIAWYQYACPHDGQSGLVAFVLGLYVAPPLGVAAFAIYFFASRKRFVS